MTRDIQLKHPQPTDGPHVSALIAACPPLDENSRYCNLLQCSHWSDTSVAAWMGDSLVGFMSGYIVPGQPDTYFVWQIAVHSDARGQNLTQRLLDFALGAEACAGVRYLQTTITEENTASKRVFQKLAERRDTQIRSEPFFTREDHFAGQHDTEFLFTIGPF